MNLKNDTLEQAILLNYLLFELAITVVYEILKRSLLKLVDRNKKLSNKIDNWINKKVKVSLLMLSLFAFMAELMALVYTLTEIIW